MYGTFAVYMSFLSTNLGLGATFTVVPWSLLDTSAFSSSINNEAATATTPIAAKPHTMIPNPFLKFSVMREFHTF